MGWRKYVFGRILAQNTIAVIVFLESASSLSENFVIFLIEIE
mgnify:CR=1 FL=1